MKIGDMINYPLQIVTDINKIQSGQAIACEYTANYGEFGVFANFGNTTKDLIELPAAASNIDGAFLFICVGYAPDGSLKLIADRNIQNFISWETLGAAKFCTSSGLDSTADDLSPQIMQRLIESQEWDEVIAGYDLNGKITDKEILWNTATLPSWTINAASSAAERIIRGGAAVDALASLISTSTSAGFRPVLIYEPIPKIIHRPDDETICPLPLAIDIKKIEPGQAISCEYIATANTVGQFANMGNATKSHIPDLAPENPNGTFYFICIGYTPSGNLKLIADRNIQGKISWETLNASGFCTSSGASTNIDDIDGLKIRLPGTISNRHVDDKNHGEWDVIISYYDIDGAVEPSDNTVWNCLSTKSWTAATLSTVDDVGTVANPDLRIARGSQDKGDAVLRQGKYDSGSVNKTVGFRPVLIVKREMRFLYLKEDNSCYTANSTVELKKVADDWLSLTNDEREVLFKTKGNEIIADANLLESLQKIKILAFAIGKEEKAVIKLSAVPHEKIILPANLISIKNFEGIDKVAVKGIFSGNGKCMMAVTVDLNIYKTFKNGSWQTIDISHIDEVLTGGIDGKAMSSILRANWDELLVEETGIGFAYLPVIETVDDKAEINEIEMQVDMNGVWNMAVPGADYSYCYPRNDIVKITLKTDGDYKINYSVG